MSESRDNDDVRDARLLAALRHAPDRDALPPREVSERILAAARAAVRAPSAAPWWQRLSAWLMQPQVAASFGTLVVAVLVGVMWSTREPPVAEFDPNEPLAGRAATTATREAASAAGAVADLREAKDELAMRPLPAAVDRETAVRAESRARTPQPKAEAPAAAMAEAATPKAESPPAAAPAAESAAAERPPAPDERDLQGLARRQDAATARSDTANAVGLASAAKAQAAEPLAGIDAALAAGARWQAAGSAGGVQHGPAQRAFWASVHLTTQGQWEAVPPTLPPAPWLVLEQGPRRTVFWVMDGALHVTSEGQSWRAPVDALRLADWQAQIARW